MFIEFALVNTNTVTPPQIDSFPHTGLSNPLSAKMNVKSLWCCFVLSIPVGSPYSTYVEVDFASSDKPDDLGIRTRIISKNPSQSR